MTFRLRLAVVNALPVHRLLVVCSVPVVDRPVMAPGLGFSRLTVLLSSGTLDWARGEFPGCVRAVRLLLATYLVKDPRCLGRVKSRLTS